MALIIFEDMPAFKFKDLSQPSNISQDEWQDWKWQLRQIKNSLPSSQAFPFMQGATPYYIRLAENSDSNIKKIIYPSEKENSSGIQSMPDPLGEEKHSPFPNLIHRYPDRVLLLATDTCAIYCRYCTRKRYTGKKQSFISKKIYQDSLEYIKNNKGIREVILSGGDPLTLSDNKIDSILKDVRSIDHIEIIRVASRLPVVCPMRMTPELIKIFKKYQPVFLMTHFNHPDEITKQTADTLNFIADSGILIFNQTVLLNGINNHPAIIQALMRRLLYLRVKPYYMFQCDPSEGTDHFRTSIENSKWIQKELWGRLSGLAMPNLSVDIPDGGGKVGIVPDFIKSQSQSGWLLEGWDHIQNHYKNPSSDQNYETLDLKRYEKEWESLKNQAYGSKSKLKKIA